MELSGTGDAEPARKMDSDAKAARTETRRTGRTRGGAAREWTGSVEKGRMVALSTLRRVHGKGFDDLRICHSTSYIPPNPQGARQRMRMHIHTRSNSSRGCRRLQIVRCSFLSNPHTPYSNQPSSSWGRTRRIVVQGTMSDDDVRLANAVDVCRLRRGAQPHKGRRPRCGPGKGAEDRLGRELIEEGIWLLECMSMYVGLQWRGYGGWDGRLRSECVYRSTASG
ncbi:hypothetical protein C8F01DRAFT_281683 [Mycena amicta]|nr:hypothetical protein C8F01DRAFT_281683 [Mycena amicta]